MLADVNDKQVRLKASLWAFIYFAPIIDREPFSSENSQKSEHLPETSWNADDDLNQKSEWKDRQSDWRLSNIWRVLINYQRTNCSTLMK